MINTSEYSIHQHYMLIALVTSNRSTCVRRSVGCVITDKFDRVLSTGYNGVPSGLAHCKNRSYTKSEVPDQITAPCQGSNALSGTQLDQCLAVHAEQNAILQTKSINDIHTIYTTTSPCIHCIKIIMNTPCKNIVFLQPYGDVDQIKDLWFSDVQAGLISNHINELGSIHYRVTLNEERTKSWYHIIIPDLVTTIFKNKKE